MFSQNAGLLCLTTASHPYIVRDPGFGISTPLGGGLPENGFVRPLWFGCAGKMIVLEQNFLTWLCASQM
jgi:hypothetical protein